VSNADDPAGWGDALRPALRFDMFGRRATGDDRYQAALDMAAFADRNSFAALVGDEHHDAERCLDTAVLRPFPGGRSPPCRNILPRGDRPRSVSE
jgi:hypothetical protein